MINAQGAQPGKYALSIFDILTRARDLTDILISDIDLADYAGNMTIMHGEVKMWFYRGKESLPYSVCLRLIRPKQCNFLNTWAKIILEGCARMTILWVRNCALKEIPMVKLYACYIMIILKTDQNSALLKDHLKQMSTGDLH